MDGVRDGGHAFCRLGSRAPRARTSDACTAPSIGVRLDKSNPSYTHNNDDNELQYNIER